MSEDTQDVVEVVESSELAAVPQPAVAAESAVEAVACSEPMPEFEGAERIALVEAMIFAHGEPLALSAIAEVTGIPEIEVREAVGHIRTQLVERGSALELVEVGTRFQFRTRMEFSRFVRELKAGRPRRLSAPALETLAVVAYRQPIVRSDIEKIRGVDVTPTLKTLLERKLVRIVGHQETVGQPALYGTTDDFLKVFGLSSLSQLPTLRDLKELDAAPVDSEDAPEADGETEPALEEIVLEESPAS